MPSCPNGHQQEFGLTCVVCGLKMSYREAAKGLVSLPSIEPEYGSSASLYAGVPPAEGNGGYSLVLALGDSPKRAKNEFVMERVQGGTWHDFYSRYSADLRRWLKVVAFGKSQFKFLLVDTTDPLSVLAVSSMPQLSRTAAIAITADETSTSMEQNTSYVAISLALRRGLRVLALPQPLVKQTISLEDGGPPTLGDTFSRMLGVLLSQPDGIMDVLEGDSSLGVGFHLLSPIVSGSKQIYGTVSNAFVAQSYLLPKGAKLEDVKTFHALVSCSVDLRGEFEEGLSQFRNRRLKSILNAECRFQDRADPFSFDLLGVYGTTESSVLEASSQGYASVAKRAPLLKVGDAE